MPAAATVLAPAALAAAMGAAYVLLNVRSADLAAHEFRSALVGEEGLTLWNGNWYGGHHTLSYSLLFPPLAALLGPKVVGALAVAGAAAAFAALARERFGPRALFGVLLFCATAGSLLFSGRLPFALGVAIGLAALLAHQRDRPWLAAALALACPLASPLAGLFLALAAMTMTLAGDPDRRRASAGLALAALAPGVLLAAAFPEGGEQPYPAAQLRSIEIYTLAAVVVLPRSERALRIGGLLYAAVALLAFVIPSPVGNNVVRLGALLGAPLLLCALAVRRYSLLRLAAGGVVIFLLGWWQIQPAVGRILKAGGATDPAGERAYFEPLIGFLERAGGPPGRLEIPFTVAKREIAEVSPEFPLARGWQRQLDVERNPLFYDGPLTSERYERWLRENGVRWVALSSSTPEFSSREEVALIRAGPPYLRERWREGHWQVYEVVPPPPLAAPEDGAEIAVADLGRDHVTLDVRRPGSAVVRVRWSPYWLLRGGCVEPAGEWTRVTARRTGRLRLVISFSPERLLDRGRRCG
jgi:hypothetical protein